MGSFLKEVRSRELLKNVTTMVAWWKSKNSRNDRQEEWRALLGDTVIRDLTRRDPATVENPSN